MSTNIRILKLLQKYIIPWAKQDCNERIIFAKPRQKDLVLPPAVHASSAGKLGKKRSVRRHQVYAYNASMAQWPEDKQEAIHTPILSYVIDGELQLRMGTYYLTLPAGHVLITPPGMPHPAGGTLYDKPNKSCDVFIMSPRGQQMQCWITEHREGQIQQVENIHVLEASLTEYLDRIIAEFEDAKLNHRGIISHQLFSLWLTLEREIMQERFVDVLPTTSLLPNPEVHNPIFIAKQYIRSHLHQHLTINNVAQKVHLSRTQFILLFRQETGQSFVEYLTQLRVEWACQLLRDTSWPIHQICTFTGFKATSYFHRFFARKTGMTPQQYRQKMKDKK